MWKYRLLYLSSSYTHTHTCIHDTYIHNHIYVCVCEYMSSASSHRHVPWCTPKKIGVHLRNWEKINENRIAGARALLGRHLTAVHAPGRQIGYSTVFFWEYFGPLVTYALFYFFPRVFYPGYKCAPALIMFSY